MDFLCFYYPLFCIHWLMDKNIFGDTKILVFIFGLVVIVLKKTMAGFPTLFITPLKLTISR